MVVTDVDARDYIPSLNGLRTAWVDERRQTSKKRQLALADFEGCSFNVVDEVC
jgi:hypothetical protein